MDRDIDADIPHYVHKGKDVQTSSNRAKRHDASDRATKDQ
ncbi:hypothetical protein KIPB_007266, partial [Kipferlia bialata]|eukprot:g7266.t1